MNTMRGKLDLSGDGGSVDLGGQTLRLPASVIASRPGLSAYQGKEIAIGLRPEHATDAELSGAQENVLEGTVEVREGLGSEVILHCLMAIPGVRVAIEPGDPSELTDTSTFLARVDPGTQLRPGDRARLAVRADHVHLFDLDSGQAI